MGYRSFVRERPTLLGVGPSPTWSVVPRGRHRQEPTTRRSLPPLPRRASLPVLAAAGVAAVLMGVGLVVTLWPGFGPDPTTQAEGRRDAAATARQDAAHQAAALRAAELQAALRSDDRASRSRPRTPLATKAAESVPKVVAKRWVTSDLNVRSAPSTGANRVDVLQALTRVGISGATRNGWSQVVVDRRAGWVKSSYLSTSKPEPKKSPAAAPGVSGAACSISPSIEPHLSANARTVYRAVCAAFGKTVSSFGGYRPGDSGDHGSGHAVDIMVSGDPGLQIARYVQAHASQFGVTYVIYQQKIWMAGNPTSQWKGMEDRGSPTANHYDHVHVSVS